jgi:hypothetical protein
LNDRAALFFVAVIPASAPHGTVIDPMAALPAHDHFRDDNLTLDDSRRADE